MSQSACKFCGSESASVRSYQNHFRVGCNKCQTLGPVGDTPEEAWKLWRGESEPKTIGPSEFKEASE